VEEHPAGFTYRPDAITADEEAALLGLLGAMTYHEVRMHGVVARRTVRHFGYDYGYDSRRVREGEPLPEQLEWLRQRCADVAGAASDSLVEVLVARYPPGASIGWHKDAPMFGSPVVGVSVASACRMRFRRTAAGGEARAFAVELAPRSIYVIGGAARWAWQHHIPATKELRYSITFRTLRDSRGSAAAGSPESPTGTFPA
jgi:alkylated DNA repair dioxygenase AlkB